MPNGKPGDYPFTDLFLHGMHPFPKDIEELVLAIHRIRPSALDDFELEPFEWERGKKLDEARSTLREKLRQLQGS